MMKHRWSILFGCTLAALVGSAWLSSSLGLGLVRASSVGQLVACAVAGFAMIRNVPDKNLVIAVLACSALELLETLHWLGVVMRGEHHSGGVPFAIMAAGTLATVGMGVAILTQAPQPPPRQ